MGSLKKIKYLIQSIFSFLYSGVDAKARRWVSPLNTQYVQKSTESGKQSVIALDSLCPNLQCAGYSVKLMLISFFSLYFVSNAISMRDDRRAYAAGPVAGVGEARRGRRACGWTVLYQLVYNIRIWVINVWLTTVARLLNRQWRLRVIFN